MRLKSFYGPNINEAMRLVREALGENAIIVTTRDEEDGGVRITAAIESSPLPSESFLHQTKFQEKEDDGLTVIEVIAEALVKHNVPHEIAERLLASATQFVSEDPVISLASALNTFYKFQPILEDSTNKPIVFVGPPGAGKTLTTAKLATQATLTKKPVVVISTDIERAGGIEQLAAFTRILKIGLMQVEDVPSLKEAICMQQADTLVLVDTPGRNYFRKKEMEHLKSLVEVCGDAILVLPADMESSEAIDMANEFRKIGAARLMVTRLDMTRRLGGFLRAAYETRLPLANYSCTSDVTKAPMPINPEQLALMMLEKDQGLSSMDWNSLNHKSKSHASDPRSQEEKYA